LDASPVPECSNSWHKYAAWPPKEAKLTKPFIPFRRARFLSFVASLMQERQALSANTSPSGKSRFLIAFRPSLRLIQGDTAHLGSCRPRFMDHRPDVLSYGQAPLDHVFRSPDRSRQLCCIHLGHRFRLRWKLIDVYSQDHRSQIGIPSRAPSPASTPSL